MPYEEYFKAASESLLIVGRGGLILEVNPQAESLFGYQSEELVGRPVEVLVPERLRDIHQKHVVGFFNAPRTRTMGTGLKLVGRRKDGTEFPLEVSLTYAPGTRRGDVVVAAAIDISQRLALEREARRAESITSLGTIAAGIAHDLNNPLQVILSRAELLQALGDSLPSEVREDLEVIQRHAQRATRIVEEFLRVSRQREKDYAPLQVSRVVDDALLLMGDQLNSSKIGVEILSQRELPPIMGDTTALERVLINLLSNARDAMRDGGRLRIETGLSDDRPGWVRLRVTDSGPGIEPGALNRIFDLLYTTKPDGTGLGLWLSRRIIQEHSGRIEVQSELGRGTTFTITLPALEESR